MMAKFRSFLPPSFVVALLVLIEAPKSACFTTLVFDGRHRTQRLDAVLLAHDTRNNNDAVPSSQPRKSQPMSRSSFMASIAGAVLTAGVSSAALADDDTASSKPKLKQDLPTSSVATTGGALEESISGFVAGATLTVTKTVVKYPLDTATVRLQMPSSQYSIFDPSNLFQGSYRGVLAPLLANIPAGAVFFAVKDACKSTLKASYTDLPRWVTTCFAVGAAQFPYWLVRNPSEVVKTRQQAGVAGYGTGVSDWEAYQQVQQDSNATDALSQFSGYYVGYWENILYAYPADVIKFVCYEQLSGGRSKLSPAEGALAGAIATAVAQFVTTPLDVVRNRVMAQEADNDVTEQSSTRKGYLESLIQLGKQEGLTGLFAGASPRVGKAMLSGAIQFATYEETKQEITKFFQRGS